MKNVTCLQRNILEMIGRMFTGWQLPFELLNPLFEAGVIFAGFNFEGKSPLSTQSLKKSQI